MTAVTRQSDGSLLVTEEGPVVMQSGSSTRYGRIFQVDPATGNRSIISDLNVNSGPDSLYVGAIQTPSGILLSGGSNLVNVDPLTGNRSLVSGDAIGGNSSIGNGWGFAPQGSDVYLTSTDQDRIFKIDTFTGNRTLVSGAGIGAGPALTAPVDVVFDQSGKMLVSNAPGGIFRVDPITGDRTIVTDSTHGVGPDSTAYYQLGLGADGTIYSAGLVAGANVTKAVFAIDPDTGNRTVLSDATHGVGPAFQEAIGLMVVPIPEPSTVVLVSIAVGICLATWNKRS
jgi:hypothetical protein